MKSEHDERWCGGTMLNTNDISTPCLCPRFFATAADYRLYCQGGESTYVDR